MGDKQVQDKGDSGDLVTVADTLAEEIILSHIRAAFPDHEIRSEETGRHGAPGDWLWLVDPLDGTNNDAIGLPVYGVSITLLHRREPLLGVICDSHLDRLYVAEKGHGAYLDAMVLYNSEGDDLYAGLLLAREAEAAVVDFDGEPFEGMNEEPYLIAAHPDHLAELAALVRDGLGLGTWEERGSAARGAVLAWASRPRPAGRCLGLFYGSPRSFYPLFTFGWTTLGT